MRPAVLLVVVVALALCLHLIVAESERTEDTSRDVVRARAATVRAVRGGRVLREQAPQQKRRKKKKKSFEKKVEKLEKQQKQKPKKKRSKRQKKKKKPKKQKPKKSDKKKEDSKKKKKKKKTSLEPGDEYKYMAFCLGKLIKGKGKTWTDKQFEKLRKKEGVTDEWCQEFKKNHPAIHKKLEKAMKSAEKVALKEMKHPKSTAKLAARLEGMGELFATGKSAVALLEEQSGATSMAATHNPVLKEKALKWPSRTLPFYFDVSIAGPERGKIVIATLGLMTGTLGKRRIRFQEVPETAPAHKLRFVGWDGCASFMGRRLAGRCSCKDCCTKWEQIVMLSTKCPIGSIQHELMHAMGIDHTQCRSDRSKFIKINKRSVVGVDANIYDPACKKWSNFEKNTPPQWGKSKLYDYSSIMHYPERAFQVPGRPNTIVPKKGVKGSTGDPTKMGQRVKPTTNDYKDIKFVFKGRPLKESDKMYKKSKTVTKPKKWDAKKWMGPSGTCGNHRKKMLKKCHGKCYSKSTHECGPGDKFTVRPHPGCKSGSKTSCCPKASELKKK